MSKPVRIQLSRRKGWKMPEGTVNVARPHRWGNPFIVTEKVPAGRVFSGAAHGYVAVPTVEDAVACFRLMLGENAEMASAACDELRGKNLACWCGPKDECHADVLLKIANADPGGADAADPA